jgi:hypothetical protein
MNKIDYENRRQVIGKLEKIHFQRQWTLFVNMPCTMETTTAKLTPSSPSRQPKKEDVPIAGLRLCS